MKHNFLKSLALITMLLVSVSMWGAIDWSGISWVGNGAGGDYTDKYKVSADAGPNVVNIQLPGFATAAGMYITFPDAAFGEIRANGAQLSYDVQGAGICLHMSNFTAKETEVQVMNSGNTDVRWTFHVYFEDGIVPPVSSTWDAGDVDAAQGVATYISAKHSGDKTKVTDDVVNGDNVQLGVYAEHPTEWLVIDLGANYEISKFSLSTTGDRKDKKFAICTASAQATAPAFADGTDALDGVWSEACILDDNYTNTGLTTLTYSVDWKNVRYLKYQATERNHSDQYGTAICEFRVKGTSTDASLTIPHHINITSVPELYAGQSGNIILTVCNSSNGSLTIDQAQLSATSSATGVATVAKDGEQIRVNAVAAGTTTVTINYGTLTKEQSITVMAAVSAPTAPTHAEDDVLSLWSDSYTSVSGYGWYDWGGCTLSTLTDNGNNIKRAKAFKWLGSQFTMTDVTGYDYFHIDLYPTAATTVGIIPITSKVEGGNNPERGVTTATLPANQWTSIDIPLPDFTTNGVLGLDRLYQLKYNKSISSTGAELNADGSFDLFVDNVYFWKAPSSAPKTVSATVNDAAMGSAVVKQNGVTVTEAEIGTNVDFIAQENDGYLFLGWYKGSTLVSESKTYTVENIQSATTLQAKFRALNTIYCHTQLTNGDKSIYLTMKRTAENTYQVVIDSETEMKGFSNAYIGGVAGAAGEQIKLNDADVKAQYVTLSENNHRLTVNVTSTKAIKWNTPVYINMPGEVTFAEPQNKVIEYEVTCDEVAVSSVTLDKTEATVDVEGKVTLVPSIAPIYADNQTITWTTSKESVATVVNGVVTGIAEGDATITAAAGGKQATCAITVQLDPTVPHVAAPTVDATGKEIRSIYSDALTSALTNDNFGLNVYGNVPYEKRTISGNNFLLYTAENDKKVISWGSGNGDANALLAKTGLTNPEDEGAKGLYAANMEYLHIDIWSSAAASNFQIQNDNDIITMVNLDGSGWQSFDLDMTGKENVLKNISIIKFTNTPTNTKVAIDNVYFWKSNGTASVTGVELNKTSVSIEQGGTATLVPTVLPAAAANKNVSFESSDTDIATVSAEGVVTGVSTGSAVITVTTEDGGFTATCNVTVIGVDEKTWWNEGRSGEVDVIYSITRNANKTLTFEVELEGTYGVKQVAIIKDGDHYSDMSSSGENRYSWTSTATYNAGETVKGFFYFPPVRVDFSYTVGAENHLMKSARTLTSSNIGTICMPQAVKAFEGASFYEIAYVEMQGGQPYKVFFDEVTELEAGHAYIFEPEEGATEIKLAYTFDAPAAAPVPVNGLHGTFEAIAAATDNILVGNYIINSNRIRKCAENCSLGANRAYIVMSEVSGYPSTPAPGRKRIALGTNAVNTPTDLEAVAGTKGIEKVMINNTIYILRDGKMFNAAGMLVK